MKGVLPACVLCSLILLLSATRWCSFTDERLEEWFVGASNPDEVELFVELRGEVFFVVGVVSSDVCSLSSASFEDVVVVDSNHSCVYFSWYYHFHGAKLHTKMG